eukprot:COSAG02_NODE_24607_length_683_cov_0.558219_1_plen_146_part_01
MGAGAGAAGVGLRGVTSCAGITVPPICRDHSRTGPPSGWLGKMAPKVAVTSVSLVDSTGAERPTLTPVLLGDRAFSGFYSPRSFRVNVSSNGYVDLRLTGSTGTSFLNYISWTLSAVVVHGTVGGSAQVEPKETAALAQSDRLATA